MHKEIHPDQDAFATESNAGGLTKREYLAAIALQGILSGLFSQNGPVATTSEAAKIAIQCADALINELNNSK